MTGNQNTAAKRARQAARAGAKFTAALREDNTGADGPRRPVAAALPFEVRQANPEWGLVGWCADAARAVELADAVTAWADGARLARVWDHTAVLALRSRTCPQPPGSGVRGHDCGS